MRRRLDPKDVSRPSAHLCGAVLTAVAAALPLTVSAGDDMSSSLRSWNAVPALTGWGRPGPLPVILVIVTGITRARLRAAASCARCVPSPASDYASDSDHADSWYRCAERSPGESSPRILRLS